MGRLVALLALSLVLVGCGAAGEARAPAAQDAATLAPADARAFAVVRTDPGSGQWRATMALLERLPAWDDALRTLGRALDADDLDLERDVLAAVGPEIAVVVLGPREQAWLTVPDDPAGLERLLGRLDKPTVTRDVGGWTAVARSASTLDRLERGLEAGSLADDAEFREAFDALPARAVARIWANGRDGTTAEATAAAVVAEQDGFRIEGTLPGAEDAAPFAPTLLGHVPAGAALVQSFAGRGELADRLSGHPIGAFLGQDGIRDLAAVLEGEGILYVGGGGLVPQVTLLSRVDDEEAAVAAVGRLLDRFSVGETGEGRGRIGLVDVAFGARDGLVAVTTARAGLGVLDAVAAPITGDPRFRAATERAELPARTAGFVYAQADELAPALSLAALLARSHGHGGHSPGELGRTLDRVGAVVLYRSGGEGREPFAGFVELR
jgi:hypothetical protein